ncbi:MAG: choice-of-anchor J domain-containing protein [Candidatus Cloacimonetes bacterium]|nr:choice-of-anchor J domain-containing protein [Candidatus Cloacimonadota bacterium]MDY0229694.1 choice-of-anchor J domain-containing protein [Candidatus Cloacimonadaceae bacterium]
MRTKLNKLILMLIFSAFVIGSWAVVSEYTFASAPGTYTEISGGTVLLTGVPADPNPSFNAIPLGFSFNYDGIDYTTVSIAENGFLAMGDEVATSNLAISHSSGTNNSIVALNRDLTPRADGEIMYLLSGTAPNRVFAVQWKNFRRFPTSAANDVLNFQILLHETDNQIVFSYGAITALTVNTAATVQVGLRGASNADFNNRTTSTDWTATEAGTTNNNNCRLSADVFPSLGLTFSFSAAQQGAPPMPAQTPSPAHLAIDVSILTDLSWQAGGGLVDGYKVYLGTNTPPSNMVNGVTHTNTIYQITPALNYSTQYFWQIVPFNTDGDALDCPIWSFTTLADPTVTSYPYVQNFDTVTTPALPLGWVSLNENNDAYNWASFNDPSAQSAPNAMRMRYNDSVVMDDWLIASPMVFDAQYIYKVKFYYRAHVATQAEKLALYLGSSPTAAAMTTQLWANENITNIAYQMVEVDVPANTGGTYYLGFHGYSPANRFYIYVDSFSVTEITEALDPPTNLAATVSGYDVHLSWDAPGDTPPPPDGFADDFESYTDFSLTFDPWVLVDVDLSTTYGMTDITWPNGYAAMAYMIFNPTATAPPIADFAAHSGNKMAACFAATTAPNNDWMMSPLMAVENGNFLNFWARSYTVQYGAERFKVGVSTGGTAPANFTFISGASYIQAPADWTLYSYDLSAYAGQDIRVGIQCLSNDAFIFLVDDVTIGAPAPTRFNAPVANANSMGSIARNTGTPIPAPFSREITRDLLGFKVYRDGALINTIANPATTVFNDINVAVGNYNYSVTAMYTGGESEPAIVNVTVNEDLGLDPPTNLHANVVGNDAHLGWDAPVPAPTGEWITWCNDVLGNGIGTAAAAIFDVAHLFDHTDLLPYMGSTLTHVSFVPNEANCVYTLKVWTGGSATTPGPMVHSQVVTAPTMGVWNEVVLTTPVPVPATGNLWFGYEANTQAGHPAGCDAGPVVEGKGNIMNFDGWTTLTQLSASLTYNWLIQGYVDGARAMAQMPAPIYEAPRAHQNGRLALVSNPNATVSSAKSLTREQMGYKLYRDGNLVATINDPATLTYIDADLQNGSYVYTLTANYDNGESAPAGPVNVTVEDLQPPTDLAATVAGNDVSLNWTNPVPPQTGEWISWSDNSGIGNSIGTGAAATFDVAHRFEASDLTQYVGDTLAQVKIAAMHADCVYTVKIWTGGSTTTPGPLVHSQVVSNPTIEDWTTVILTNPIPITAGTQYWIGYGVNTQGGHPAGCDMGPMVPGKGNIMNFGGWTTLDQVSATLTYNWLIQTFVAQGRSLKAIELPAIVEAPLPVSTGQLTSKFMAPSRDLTRAVLLGYKVYRDGTAITTINDPEVVTYTDNDLPNADYVYGVSALYNSGESAMVTIDVNVNLQVAPAILEDSFEEYADFATAFGYWTMLDQDHSDTYGFTGIDFPGSGSQMAFMVFNPSQTVPPITDMDPYEGDKMVASFAAVTPPNKDWMISRRINLGTNSSLKFYARSHTSNYGLETFKVGVSTMPTIITQGFQYLTGAQDVQAPAAWTEYMYDLSAYDEQDVYIAIRCTSNDAFVFYVDNFSVHTEDGEAGEDATAPVLTTALKGNYPNPFNPETTIRFSTKEAGPVALEIYNVKGQLIKKLVNEDKAAGEHTVVWNGTDQNNRAVSTGVYFYKMNAGKYSSTRKMIMMK